MKKWVAVLVTFAVVLAIWFYFFKSKRATGQPRRKLSPPKTPP